MKKKYIVAASILSFLISFSALAQVRSARIEYMQDGKKVVKEYNGAELDKLMHEAEVKAAESNKTTAKKEIPAERQVIIQEQGKEPVIYKGAELDKLIQQSQQAVVSQAAQPKPIPQNSAAYVITAVKQADGSVKYIKSSGTEKMEK